MMSEYEQKEKGREERGNDGDLMVSTHPPFSKVKSESFDSKWQGAPDTPPPPIILPSPASCPPAKVKEMVVIFRMWP